MQTLFRKIIEVLLLLGIFFFMYWPTVYGQGFPLRFELFFFLAVVLFGITIFLEWRKGVFHIDTKTKPLYITTFFFIASILLATCISYIRHGLHFNFLGFTTIAKVTLGIATFITIIETVRVHPTFYKKIAWALTIPTLLLTPFLLAPALASRLGFISDGYRFQGLTSNPNTFSFLAITALAFLYSVFIDSVLKKVHRRVLLGYSILVIATGGLIIWSQSRSYVFVMLLIALLTPTIYGVHLRIKKWKVMCFSLLGIMLIGGSFFVTPLVPRNLFLYTRVLGISEVAVMQYAKSNQQETTLQPSVKEFTANLELDPRAPTWRYYLPLVPKHPFGLGANYRPSFLSTPTSPLPIFIFNVWAIGGVFGVFCLCYLLWKAYLRGRVAIINPYSDLSPYKIGAGIALCATWLLSLFFGLPIEYLGFWVVFALTLA